MTQTTMPVEAFGRALIASGDLDPVYTALSRVEWDERQLNRWLVAYWLFYHPGASCHISEAEGSEFWDRVYDAARNDYPPPVGERWPRASERRHFRGEAALKAVIELRRRFPGGHELVPFVQEAAPNYKALFNRICSLPQFGPWMAFKVADMLERVLGVPVDFDLGSVTMFDDPKKAALMVARQKLGLADNVKLKDPDGTIRQVVEHLIKEYADLGAPPNNDRPIGYQEAETVLCKWKSHVNGHYPVGKDCREIKHGLIAWATVSPAAGEFLHWMPSGELATGGTIPAGTEAPILHL